MEILNSTGRVAVPIRASRGSGLAVVGTRATRARMSWSRPGPPRQNLDDILHVPADLMDADAPADVISRAAEAYGGVDTRQQCRRTTARRPAPDAGLLTCDDAHWQAT